MIQKFTKVLLIFTIFCNELLGQNFRGTLITGFAVTDGIVIFTDSRTTSYNNKGEPVFSVDNWEKSALIGNNIVCVGGNPFIGDTSVIYYIKQIEKVEVSAEVLAMKIRKYFNTRFPIKFNPKLYNEIEIYIFGINEGNAYLSGGRIDLKNVVPTFPFICSKKIIDTEIKSSIIIKNHNEAFSILELLFEEYSMSDTTISAPYISWFIPYDNGIPECLMGCNNDSQYISKYDIVKDYFKGKLDINVYKSEELLKYFNDKRNINGF